jgi:Tol biopolymer transport system component
VNTSQFEFSPFYSFLIDLEDGRRNFYFDRGPTNAATDIYAAWIRRDGATTEMAERVDELSSAAGDGHATVRLDGREVLLHSNRSGVNFDIYVSTRGNMRDPWSVPALVTALSAPEFHEIHPSLSLDGRTIVFVRGIGTANDIWMAMRE